MLHVHIESCMEYYACTLNAAFMHTACAYALLRQLPLAIHEKFTFSAL